MCTLTDAGMAESIRDFHEYPRSGDQAKTQIASRRDRGGVEPIRWIEPSYVVERISEYFGHGNGFPCA
jgi:hypothetical protein